MRHLKEVLTLILVTNLILVQPTLIDVNITRSFSIALEDATYISQAIYLEKYLSLYDVFWVYAATTINISGIVIPSGTTAIVITLINNGSVPIENIEIFLDLSYIGEVNETTKRYNDKVDPNHSVSFAFKIEPFDNISISEYDAIMQVFYYVEDTQIYDEMLVPIAVTGYPELKIHSSALYFSSEGDYNLTIEIENIGTGPARKTIVHTLGYPPYVTVLGDDWSEIGIIPAGTKKKVTFTLHIIESGVSAIPIFVNTTFMDQRTTDFYSVAETIPVIYNETPRLSMISSVYVPTKLFPGDKNVQINVVISNPTMKIIRDIIAELILPNDIKPSYAGSSRVSLGSLPPGYTVTLTYYLDIEENAKPRSTNLELLVIFDGGENRFNIPIIIERKGSFSIESISPSILELGKRGITLQIGIINNGSV
ncbi:MAG: COG1361 S-layer family protein, partial [Candidatus Njordarchaeum guaymaensis]